jgi:hypothetical protein
MATKKTKQDSITLEMPGTIGGAKVVLPKEKKSKLKNVDSGGWPKINQGTHLTVKTFEDGRTELVWDDEQLLKEVKEATASTQQIESVTPTKKTKGKKNVSTQ